MPTHPIVSQSTLCTSDALYGERNEAMRLRYKVKENETIQYVEVMSLYTYSYKNFNFPSIHTVIHVGNACRDIKAFLCTDGMIKYSIVSTQRLYHPVLPFRYN